MKDLADATICVIDRTIYFPVALRLARDAKKVYYHHPNGEAFKTFAEDMKGFGHKGVTLLHDFWPYKKDIDAFIFPDIGDAGLQLELESQGFPVWGSRDADHLEENRKAWMDTCERIGLPMPRTHKVVGLTNLKLFLLEEHSGEYLFVKISRWRGDMETWSAKEPAQIQNKLDHLATRFGPFKEKIIFWVQEKLETDIEGGADTYFVRNDFPSKIILGYEKKGQSYFATWMDRTKMPPEIWEPMEKVRPVLQEHNYINAVSSEVLVEPRVSPEVRVPGGSSNWLDPCFRFPSPAGEEELEMYSNFSEILYLGAHGELREPEMAAKFCGEAVISYCGDREAWKSFEVPEEVAPWVKLYACAQADGAMHFPPSQDPDAVGCAVAIGNTPEEVVDGLKEIEEALKGAPVELHIAEIADLFTEIEKAEDEGIPFTKLPMPEPASVIEE